MIVRPAELTDLQTCLTIDPAYLTEYVWQVDVQEETDRVAVAFRTLRLPRPVHVAYPRDREALLADWHRRDCFLVATAQKEAAPQIAGDANIIGYLTMAAHDWHKTGWVADLVVAPEKRRQGVASRLLQAGKEWARQEGLQRLTVETQTKNYPAIRLLERHHFVFCGYNDRYYADQDIALFFTLNLR